MLQINMIRQNPGLVKERLQWRNFANPEAVDRIVQLDEEIRKAKADTEAMQASINQLSKETGMLMSKGQQKKQHQRKQKLLTLKERLNTQKLALTESEKAINNILVSLPNLPHESVPKGSSATDNEIVREGGIKPNPGA